MGYQRRVHGETEAEADPYYGYGYSGVYGGLGLRSYGGYGLGYSRGYSTLGYSGLGYSRGYYGGLGYGRGYYGKREAEAEPEADPYYGHGYSGLYGGYGLSS